MFTLLMYLYTIKKFGLYISSTVLQDGEALLVNTHMQTIYLLDTKKQAYTS